MDDNIMNLTHFYFNGDWHWMDKYISSMGEEEFLRYVNRVYIRLDKMKIGEVYDVIEHVVPSNYDLFIKTTEWFMLDVNKGFGDKRYEFNDEYTNIRCIRNYGNFKKEH